MKTITISDETYRRLESVKAGISFSETIDGLISPNVSDRMDHLLEISSSDASGREEELSRVVQGIRKRARARLPS